MNTAGRSHPRAARRRSRAIPPAVIGALMLAGCTGTPATTGPLITDTASMAAPSVAAGFATSVAAGSASPVTAGSASPVAAGSATSVGPEALLRTAVATLNGAAGSVAGQQRVLATLVAAGQRDAQRACPAATSTLTLEPVWSDLVPAPDWRPGTGMLAGTVYSLPTLIRIHRDGRIVGTDLADLHAAVDDGLLGLTVLCIA